MPGSNTAKSRKIERRKKTARIKERKAEEKKLRRELRKKEA